MGRLTMKKTVRAPLERTFAVFTDLRRAEENLSGVTKLEVLTDGPVGRGTTFRETRIIFKKEATEELTFTDFRPPESMTIGCTSCGVEYSSVYTFRPVADGTEVELVLTSRPRTLFARLMSPLGALMAGTMKKMIGTDMDELAAVAEGEDEAPATA
jgi:hypothetical protein